MRFLISFLLLLAIGKAEDIRVILDTKKTIRKEMMEGKGRQYKTLITIKHKYDRQQLSLKITFVRKGKDGLVVGKVRSRAVLATNKAKTSLFANHIVYDDSPNTYYGIVVQVYSDSGSLLVETAKPTSLLKKMQELQEK